jgi:hypothetical protein
MALLAAGNACPLALAGTQQVAHYQQPPLLNASADCQSRFSQQLVDNRTDIFVNQPIINNRDHHINNINTQIIRDNNFYHYHQQHLFRDNVINHFSNRVLRQQNSFADYSCSSGVLPGSVTNINHGTSFHHLGATCQGVAGGYGWF